MEGIITEQKETERSVVHGALGYYAKRGGYATLGGLHSEQNEVQAFDGQWTRCLQRTVQDGQEEQQWASLSKGDGGKAEGRHDGLPVLRPYTFLVRDNWLYGPLSDLLVSPWLDKINKYRLRFRYCGEENLDGHPCVKLRGEVTAHEGQPPSSFMAFWLATDRNYIPIKLEHYGGNFGVRRMPSEPQPVPRLSRDCSGGLVSRPIHSTGFQQLGGHVPAPDHPQLATRLRGPVGDVISRGGHGTLP